ncbi:Gfo/Idh/MocA family oxidoreductase [Mesobacillus foraminis]|uniref:Gfo/Idh/MocA family protein n=1 Tax=Mesobacillus foraminis TaxID=279826 RepID=UPI0039A0FF59
MEKKLRFGVLGCANIAVGSVIPALKKSELCEVVAIASRGIEKAERTAAELGIERAYGSYEELLSDPEVDAVYIPLPNHLHKEWTIKSAQAGKHVLCEKPLALNQEEAEEMVQACREAGVKLAEAFMYRHHPRYSRVKEIIDSGEIGTIRAVNGSFTFNNAGDAGNVRYRADWGGGAIYDVGCYPISAARFLLGQEPEAATVQAFFSPEHDHVDMMASGLIEFPNHVGLTFTCGMWAEFQNTLQVIGSEGRIDIPSAFVAGSAEAGSFTVTVKGEKRTEESPAVNQYSIQGNLFARSILENTPLRFESEDAIFNMKAIDACLTSAKEKQRVVLRQSR